MTDTHKRQAELEWTGDLHFTAKAAGVPQITIDGDGKIAPSPVTMLLYAAGACTGSDVAVVMAKKRIKLSRLHIDIGGRRAPDYPRRFLEMWVTFRMAGEGLTEAAARRAVDLSLQKYCSVLLSLNPDIPIRTEIVIEQEQEQRTSKK